MFPLTPTFAVLSTPLPNVLLLAFICTSPTFPTGEPPPPPPLPQGAPASPKRIGDAEMTLTQSLTVKLPKVAATGFKLTNNPPVKLFVPVKTLFVGRILLPPPPPAAVLMV